jgi:RNA polymerase sigma-70 factor, ECF subfamily
MFFTKSIADEDQINAASAGAESFAADSAELAFIEKLRAGDAGSFDQLVTRFSGEVYALLCRLTENADEARDLTQETFMSALTAIGRFRGDCGVKTWLFRIAINHSRNRFRWWKRRRRDRTVSLEASIGNTEMVYGDLLADRSADPEASALIRERELALIAALRDLPDIFREPVVLCDIEGMSYEEIAVTLGIGLGTVKSRIARGRSELRRQLKDL